MNSLHSLLIFACVILLCPSTADGNTNKNLPFVTRRSGSAAVHPSLYSHLPPTTSYFNLSLVRSPIPKRTPPIAHSLVTQRRLGMSLLQRAYEGPFFCPPHNETDCLPTPNITCPPLNFDCELLNGTIFSCTDDFDVCTENICDPGSATGCVYTPILGCCSAQHVCLLPGQVCICNTCEDACTAFNMNCDDNDPCTIDTCVAGECIHTVISCDDSNPATVDFCNGGACTHVYVPLYCSGVGNTSLCEDRGCTTVACINNQCVYTPIFNCCVSDVDCFVHLSATNATDNNCTTSFCFHTCVGGCHSECRYNLVQCLAGEGHGDICTTEQCIPEIGQCVAVEDPCDDHNECTIDFCAPICTQSCCRHNATNIGEPCEGNTGTCDGEGNCVPFCEDVVCPSHQCSNGFCDLTTGNCTYVSADDCEFCTPDPENPDNICRPTGTCECGQCVPGPYVDCDDSNPCTNDILNLNALNFGECCLHVLFDCNDPESVPLDCCCANCTFSSGPGYPDCAENIPLGGPPLGPQGPLSLFCPNASDICHSPFCLLTGECTVIFNVGQPGCCNVTEDCTGTPPPCNEFLCNNTICVLIPIADGGICSDPDWICTTNGTCWNGLCVETEFTPAPECCDDNHFCDNSPENNPPCQVQYCDINNECVLTYFNNEADCCSCDADCVNSLQPPFLVTSSIPLGVALTFGALADVVENDAGLTFVSVDAGYVTAPNLAWVVAGTVHVADLVYDAAVSDVENAIALIQAASCSFTFLFGDVDLSLDVTHGPAGTYTAGLYCVDGNAFVNSDGITLDGAGVFVFRVDNGALTTVDLDVNITFINGASPCNLFWLVEGNVTIGIDFNFAGTLISLSNITFENTSSLFGHAFAVPNGTISTLNNEIATPDCSQELLEEEECYRRMCDLDTNQCIAKLKQLAPCTLPIDDPTCMLYGQCSSLGTCEPNPWFFNDTVRPGCCQIGVSGPSGPFDFSWDHTDAASCTLLDVQDPPFDPENVFQMRCYEAVCNATTHSCSAYYVGGECGCCQVDADCACEPCNSCQTVVCNVGTNRCERQTLPDNSTCLPAMDPCFEYGLCDDGVCVPAGGNACDDQNECTCDSCVTNFNNNNLFDDVNCTHTAYREGEICYLPDYTPDGCLRYGTCFSGVCEPSSIQLFLGSGPVGPECKSTTCHHGLIQLEFNTSTECECDPLAANPCGIPVYPDCQTLVCKCITCPNDTRRQVNPDDVYRCVINATNFGQPCDASRYTQDECFQNGRCDVNGICVPVPMHLPLIDDANQCSRDFCSPADGLYSTPLWSDSCCDDGLECTVDDHCDGNGTCIGGGPRICPANIADPSGRCLVPTCFEGGGGCGWTPLPPNTICDPPDVDPENQFCFFCQEDFSCVNLCNPDWVPSTVTALSSTTIGASTSLSASTFGLTAGPTTTASAAATTTIAASSTGSGASGITGPSTGPPTVSTGFTSTLSASTTEADATIVGSVIGSLTFSADTTTAAVTTGTTSAATTDDTATTVEASVVGSLTVSAATTTAATTGHGPTTTTTGGPSGPSGPSSAATTSLAATVESSVIGSLTTSVASSSASTSVAASTDSAFASTFFSTLGETAEAATTAATSSFADLVISIGVADSTVTAAMSAGVTTAATAAGGVTSGKRNIDIPVPAPILQIASEPSFEIEDRSQNELNQRLVRPRNTNKAQNSAIIIGVVIAVVVLVFVGFMIYERNQKVKSIERKIRASAKRKTNQPSTTSFISPTTPQYTNPFSSSSFNNSAAIASLSKREHNKF